ncbi:MAG: serine dehydratase subunit alpha family protein [Oscillospiraceae bacterium]|jgi:L-cysteine desulfidase
MNKTDRRYQMYLDILQEELLPALGCTEPIAVAYAAANARSVLPGAPERLEVAVSNNIVKNVKSVIVPNTGGLKGIQAAAAIGAVAGNEKLALEVISSVTERDRESLRKFLAEKEILVKPAESTDVFDIRVDAFDGEGNHGVCRIQKTHTNVTLLAKNDVILLRRDDAQSDRQLANREMLSVEGILDFAQTCELEDIKPVLSRQIRCNSAISNEGLKTPYGANIGKLFTNRQDLRSRAIGRAAAGSDARMSGCDLPVIINSGSGNQGMTASLPVLTYAEELQVGEEKTYRALALSNLLTIHLRSGIGTLSAYCGAVSAGSAAGAAVCWLQGGDYDAIAHTLVNSLAIVSGIICDGAKPSCAAKIACAVDAGLFGWEMYQNGQQFFGGDGIVEKGVENTIRNVSRLGRDGMRQTDDEIVKIMIEC